MKNLLVILFSFLLYCLINGGQAHAFVIQGSIEFTSDEFSPYPYVVSPAIDNLPQGFITINVGYDTYYYFDGIFYQKIMRIQKYVAVSPPIGAVLFTIPQGYELILTHGVSYYEYGNVYYKRDLGGFRVIPPPGIKTDSLK